MSSHKAKPFWCFFVPDCRPVHAANDNEREFNIRALVFLRKGETLEVLRTKAQATKPAYWSK